MRADPPLPSVEYADEPVTIWLLDAPLPSVEEIPGVPDGVEIPDGVVANFTGCGLAVAGIIAKPGLYPEYSGRGTLTAVIRIKVAVTAAFGGEGTVALPGSIPARFTGSGALAAVAYPGRVLGAPFTGSGTLGAVVIPVGTTDAPFTGSGQLAAVVAVPVAANFTGSGTLSAAALGGIPVAAALNGAGTLSATTSFRYAVAANFTGSGALAVSVETRVVAADFTGSGTLSAVAEKVGVSLSDDFNRSNGALGANWTAIGTAPTIVTNRAEAGTPGLNTTVVYAARHNTPLGSDTQEVIWNPITATAGSSTSLGGAAFLRSTSGGDRVEVAITNTQVIINTRIGGTSTSRATASASSPTSVRMTAVGNVYSAYLNGSGTAAVTWTDSGNVITIGSTTRYVGIVCVANTNFASSTTRGWSVDAWSAADI